MNNQGGITTNGATMMTGVNTLGLVALLAYSVRNINELHENLSEIKEELKILKSSHIDNTKRTHAAIGKLSERITSKGQSSRSYVPPKPEPKIMEVDDDLNDQIDDVSAAINELMKN
jgi:hypothetical protein